MHICADAGDSMAANAMAPSIGLIILQIRIVILFSRIRTVKGSGSTAVLTPFVILSRAGCRPLSKSRNPRASAMTTITRRSV
jgi:hypothetical protein